MFFFQGNTVPRGYDHLVYCQYNGEACSFVNFTELVHLRYIQCFTFTPQNRKLAGDRGLTFVYASQRAGTPFMLLNDLEVVDSPPTLSPDCCN
ncbi:unnamed protein product [Dibothriocephalus latus]|uniref:Uncharacterized protein n=1 Tax=Dibothriocephalus latus TaxID=60516 RepID=A0A3P7N662_DIBLA|nr:unnamed protein product [Dibothriocephalus latus]